MKALEDRLRRELRAESPLIAPVSVPRLSLAGLGTEAAAPFWAGLIAVADQYAGHDLVFVNPALHCITAQRCVPPGLPGSHHQEQQVTIAPNTFAGYQARAGWDPVAGWGSPDAQTLIPLLAD